VVRSQRVLDILVGREPAPGCSAAVGERGEVVWQGVGGLADVEAGTKITSETVFDIASVSKQFTATGVLLVAAQGRLSLDDPMSKHLTGFPAWADTVTVAQLMHQVSGVPEYIKLLNRRGYSLEEETSRDLAFKAIADVEKLRFRPGSKWEYSNSNYLLLGAILEEVSDQPIPAFLRQQIFDPLQLDMMVATPTVDVPGKARPYRAAAGGTGFEVADWRWDVTGAGGIQSTPADLIRWADNYRARTVGGAELYEQQLAHAAPTDQKTLRYGAGIFLAGDGHLWHAGGFGGFRTHFFVSADRNHSLAVSCNLAEFQVGVLIDQLMSIWLPA
jgi:CubicO group peptidase (beta-lactamase class C family)